MALPKYMYYYWLRSIRMVQIGIGIGISIGIGIGIRDHLENSISKERRTHPGKGFNGSFHLPWIRVITDPNIPTEHTLLKVVYLRCMNESFRTAFIKFKGQFSINSCNQGLISRLLYYACDWLKKFLANF